MKSKQPKNYLDYVPVRNPGIQYHTDEKGIVTVEIEWKGFYHRIAQRFFHRPMVSDIRLDNYGSFVWLIIDDQSDVHQLQRSWMKSFRIWRNLFPGSSSSLRSSMITV